MKIQEKSRHYVSNPLALFEQSIDAFVFNFKAFFLIWLYSLLATLIILVGLAVLNIAGAGSAGVVITTGNVILGVALAIVFLWLIAMSCVSGVYVYLKSVREVKLDVKDIVRAVRKYWLRMILFNIVYGVFVAVGFLLFIVPGIIWATWYSLTPFFMIEEGLGTGEAMARSKAIVKERFWDVLGVLSTLQLFSLVQIIPIIGVIASFGFALLYGPAAAIRYITLKEYVDEGKSFPPVSEWNYVPLILVAIVAAGAALLAYSGVIDSLSSLQSR